MCCWSRGGRGGRRGSSAAQKAAPALLLGIAGEARQAGQGLAARSRHAVRSTTRTPRAALSARLLPHNPAHSRPTDGAGIEGSAGKR